MTRTTPRRWTILHFMQIFFTDALTFIASSIPSECWTSPLRLLVAINYAPARQIVRRKLDRHPIAGQDADEIFPHLAGNMGQDLMLVFELDAKHRVGKRLDHPGHTFGCAFFPATLARLLVFLHWPSCHALLSIRCCRRLCDARLPNRPARFLRTRQNPGSLGR